jgi:hypothetical protein
VLKGQAGASLLETYHPERHPLGLVTTQNALENCLSMGRTARQDEAKLPRSEFLNEQGLIFGATYESAAVIPDGSPPEAVDDPVTQYVPSARPGRRAPHVWLERAGERISTIDLFGGRFVLLTGPGGEAWEKAAGTVGHGRPELAAHMIGGDEIRDPEGAWFSAYEIERDGAVLVRPDGYVAWRTRNQPPDPTEALAATFDHVLGRRGP